MKRFAFNLICVITAWGLNLPSTVTAETYSATDGNSYLEAMPDERAPQSFPEEKGPEEVSKPTIKSAPSVRKKQDSTPKVALKKNTESKADCRVQTLIDQRGKFDSVPEEHLKSLVERIQITQELLRKHRRAYDYRIHSASELRAILETLDQDEKTNPSPRTDAKEPVESSEEE